MEKTEINKLLFAFVNPEGCWHELAPDRWVWKKGKYPWSRAIHNPDCNKCIKCGRQVTPYHSSGPDHDEYGISENDHGYTWDLNKVAKVETKFIEAFGRQTHIGSLLSVRYAEDGYEPHPVGFLITASALTRATAMAEYLKKRDDTEKAST